MKITRNAQINFSLIKRDYFMSRAGDLLIFFILILLVSLVHFDLLRPTLRVGFTPDDWSFVFWYKLLGLNPFSKFLEVWSVRGPYTTVPLYYTGIIHSLVGFDFIKIQLIGILLKTFATLMAYPLIFLVFKNRLLAFLTVTLFAISYPSTGALETVVEPSEYLGMFFAEIFMIVYYFVVNDSHISWKRLLLATVLFVIALMMSIMRVYPLLALIVIVELFFLIRDRSFNAIKTFVVRTGILFSPFILITLYKPALIMSYIGVIPTVLMHILEGNTQLLLTPLQGLGHTLPISSQIWNLLGLVRLGDMKEYLLFIFNGPFLVSSMGIFFIGLLTAKKVLRFILVSFLVNLILYIFVYFFATYYLSIPIEKRISFDMGKVYPTFFGCFIVSLSFAYWLEWKMIEKKDYLFLALWIGPSVSFIFIVLTWLLASENLAFGGAQDHYLLIPSLGVCLFISSIIVLIYRKMQFIKNFFIKSMCFVSIILVLFLFYTLNRDLIYRYFNNANQNGRAADGQKLVQSVFFEKIKDVDLSKPVLFYFDTSELNGNGPFYTEGLLSPLPFIMHFNGNNLVDGCFEVFYENKRRLKDLKVEKNGIAGFNYRSLCVKNGQEGGYYNIHYRPENFYAYLIKDNSFVDIKRQTLEELGFSIEY